MKILPVEDTATPVGIAPLIWATGSTLPMRSCFAIGVASPAALLIVVTKTSKAWCSQVNLDMLLKY